MVFSNSQNSYYALFIWLFVTLFYCYQYVLRLLPNMIMPELMKKFSVGATEIGTFAGIYYIGYILMYIPIGILLSRYGAKIILPICILFSAFGLLPIMFATHWSYVLLGRLCIGIASSAAIIGAFQIFRSIFKEGLSQMLGAMICVGLISAIYIGKPLVLLRDSIGVFSMLGVLMILGLLLAFLCYIYLPHEIDSNDKHFAEIFKSLLTNSTFFYSSILAGLMVASLEGFVDTHATAFFNALYNLERSVADSIASSILTGMCVGSIVLPYIAEKTKAYYSITALAALGISISFFTMFFTPNISIFLLYTINFIIGICSAYQVIILSKIASYFPEKLAGIAGAMANMIIMGFGYIFNVSIGRLLDFYWSGTTHQGIRIYDAITYTKAISIIPIASTIAAIGFIAIIITRRNNHEL